MIATIDADDRVLKVEGDRDHPATRGYSCAKGRAIPERHHSANRLLHPRLDGKQTSWEACLDDLGARLDNIRKSDGAGAIGRLLGTGGAYDTLGSAALARLCAELGTAQSYSVGTVDTAPLYRAAQMVTGYHNMMPHWAPEEADGPSLAILLGANFCVSHGYLGVDLSDPVRKLREFRQRGGEVWAVDPRKTRTAAQCNRHLALRPGSDVWLLAWLVREVLAEGADEAELAAHCAPGDVSALREAVAPFSRDLASLQTGLPAGDLDELLAAIRRHRRIAVLSGTGIAFSPQGLLCEWLRWALLVVTGSLDREDGKGMFFNATSLARPELGSWSNPSAIDRKDPPPASRPDIPGFYGEHPVAALADEIEAGNLKALIVFGSNPLIALPDPERVRRALGMLEALVVIDPFDNEIARLATHALPSAWLLERSDVRQRPTRIQFAPALVEPRGEAKPGWWIFAQIAERLGLDAFGDDVALADRDEETCFRAMFARARLTFDELKAAGTHGNATPRLDGWFHKAVLRERGWRIAPPALIERLASLAHRSASDAMLVSGRVDYATNSMAFPPAMRRHGELPAIHVSLDLAQARGLRDGDMARIATDEGHLEGPTRIDGNLHPGTVWIGHGWSKRNVNQLIGSAEIDELTVQPYMTALPVRVERLG